jgi:spore germination cell wall hydrolase CwlJ-like protein
MLTSSRIKLILLSLLIPILVTTLWSLTNNNNDTYRDITLYYKKNRSNTLVEVRPVETVVTVSSIKMPEPVVIPKIITTVPTTVSKEHTDQIRCMAHNIYYEAGGEPYMGQVAVARVVINRVNHGFAANPCQVIYQKHTRINPETERAVILCQFSWVCQGKLSPNTASDRYKTAHEIAELVITENKWRDEFKEEVLFFHNHTVNPRWPYKKSFTIGNHTFYAKN